MLDQIPVKCKLCGQSNIQRANFQDHIDRICPEQIGIDSGDDTYYSCEELHKTTQTHSGTGASELTDFELIKSNKKTSRVEMSEHDSIFHVQQIDGNIILMHVKSEFNHLSTQEITVASREVIINKECTHLNLFDHPFLPENVSRIVSSLSMNTLLQSLELGKCSLNDSGVRSLAESLSKQNSLKCLDLYENSITDTGVEYLVEMLRTNKSLTQLKLAYNQISNEGVGILAHGLIHDNSTLKHLSLAGNKFIDDLSGDSICNIIRLNQTLKILNLEDCNFNSYGPPIIRLCTITNFRIGLQILL
jgi:Ran GTPase-activating protein (RanGAP) involved in mRNA processing and transport